MTPERDPADDCDDHAELDVLVDARGEPVRVDCVVCGRWWRVDQGEG